MPWIGKMSFGLQATFYNLPLPRRLFSFAYYNAISHKFYCKAGHNQISQGSELSLPSAAFFALISLVLSTLSITSGFKRMSAVVMVGVNGNCVVMPGTQFIWALKWGI